MVAKKNYYKQKLNEKRIEILLQIIEEEVDNVFNEILKEQDDSGGDGKGLGRIVNRSNTVGMLLSPVSDIWNAIKFRTAEVGIKAAKTVAQFVGVAISGLLPFNDYHVTKHVSEYFNSWEDQALAGLDQQFAKERAEMMQGWETFKTDFWGIGFVAAPMNAIAGLAVAGKGIDAAFSVLNVASGGRAASLYRTLSGERQSHHRHYSSLYEAEESEQPKEFKDLPEDEKKRILDELMNNPEIKQAVDQWSAINLPKALGKVVHYMNQDIASGKAGNVTPQEIASYKAMAPKFVANLFEKMKGKNKKFDIKPSPTALAAASKAVEAEIKSMPDVPTQQPQAPQPATTVQTVEQQPKQ